MFQFLSSGPCGVDPYASAVSDVYQDLFGEGSYTGKGIYNVDVFEKALKGRIPENRLLSHDLFEGSFARCGLVSDVEFFEDFPSHLEVSVARVHRWIRGDWQLLPWVFGRGGRSISLIGRFKMFDNLRRSLSAPMTFLLLVSVFCIPKIDKTYWINLSLLSLGLPHFVPLITAFFSIKNKFSFAQQIQTLIKLFMMGLSHFFLNIVLLPYYSWISLDAILRTIFRLFITKRKLLEWTTSAQSKTTANLSFKLFFFRMIPVEIVIALITFLVFKENSSQIIECSPFLFFWFLSPFFAWIISLPVVKKETLLKEEELFILRNVARKTWSFFATFVTVEENFLPPDNFQEDPELIIAHRSSPTNFGLYLLSTISARDFGWIGMLEMVERLELTLLAMQKLPRYDGHFFNWYRTTDCHALEPQYISSVDNGNLVGHLVTVAQACEEFLTRPSYSSDVFLATQDSMRLLKELINFPEVEDLEKLLKVPLDEIVNKENHFNLLLSKTAELIDKINSLKYSSDVLIFAKMLESEIKSHVKDFNLLAPWKNKSVSCDYLANVALSDFDFQAKLLIANLGKTSSRDSQINFFIETLQVSMVVSADLVKKIKQLSSLCRQLVNEMNFNLLFDPTKKLFSIGFRMSDRSLDDSYYDLLASEARLLSFVAIAKGDISATHWFRLGRSLATIEKGVALISWSGSMFEYLMPSLVMQTPRGSLLDKTCHLIIKKQISYAEERSVPWGISESACNIRDLHLTYQYSNFGIPELGFKRGLGQSLVIAPYATLLASMFDPVSAVKNLKFFFRLNVAGIFGLYEAIDFTKERLPEGKDFVIIKTYMAHHQGMSLVSIANVIHSGSMRRRFHNEPFIQACELLLQERTPQNVVTTKKRRESLKFEHLNEEGEATIRRYNSPKYSVPRTHLLSNGSYSVMITAAGSGYSRFQDIAITRWREDVSQDNWGSYIYLRDIQTSDIWSASFQPTCVETDKYEAIFMEDRAKITRLDRGIVSHLEIFISPENNTEIRTLNLTNKSVEEKYIEVTSYAEVVLNTQGADIAHPVFSNLFIQTEFIKEFSSLIVSRRPRSSNEAPLWMAHVIATDFQAFGEIEFETDRSRFIGRGRSIRHPISIENRKSLSGTIGPVLDPIVSLRTRVKINPGMTAKITYSSIVGATRDEVLKLAERFHDNSMLERTSTLAWTEAQIRLHYLNIKHSEANLFQQLANRVLYLDSSLRPSSDILKRNSLNVTGLWAHGISGDYPIVLLRIDNIDDRSIVRQLLRAHEYWVTKQLLVDLVILNEKTNSYSQELYETLEAMIAGYSYSSGCYIPKSRGKIFILRADLISSEERELLQTTARATLIAKNGNLAEQVKRFIRKKEEHLKTTRVVSEVPLYERLSLVIPALDFFNGLGGFTKSGREYFIHLKKDQTTPAPWINVIANSNFGFQVSESGAGSTWSVNGRENKITPWSNDPVCDPSGECFYILDKDTGRRWGPTISPDRIKNAEYVIHHGQGETSV